jgi:hypothetical protein
MSKFADILFRKAAGASKSATPFTLSMTCGSMWKVVYDYKFVPCAGFTVSKNCSAVNGTLVIRNHQRWP